MIIAHPGPPLPTFWRLQLIRLQLLLSLLCRWPLL
jgi:hypothetical protein